MSLSRAELLRIVVAGVAAILVVDTAHAQDQFAFVGSTASQTYSRTTQFDQSMQSGPDRRCLFPRSAEMMPDTSVRIIPVCILYSITTNQEANPRAVPRHQPLCR